MPEDGVREERDELLYDELIEMIDSSTNTLLCLLCLALGNNAGCSLPADIDWKDVIGLSFEQGVAAIAVDGLQRLYDTNPGLELALDGPELEVLKYEWLGSTFQTENSYRDHLAAIASLAKLYSESGISMMLLKGYGLSLNYPVPEHRPAGDIDVYLINDNDNCGRLPAWKCGDEIIRKRGIRVEEGHEHHTAFSYQGQMAENHYDFINTKAHRDAPKIEAKLKSLAANGSREHLLPDGTKILLPSADFNVIFLIRHLGQHFAGEHICLRQILDYGLFLQKEGGSVHWSEIAPFIKEIGIWTFFNQINAICEDYLGLHLAGIPAIERNEELEKRILEDVLHPEFAEEKPSGLIPVLTFKARRWWHNRWKHPLVYNEWLLPMLLTLAWSHLRRIKTIKD